jgi:hypothetical protein
MTMTVRRSAPILAIFAMLLQATAFLAGGVVCLGADSSVPDVSVAQCEIRCCDTRTPDANIEPTPPMTSAESDRTIHFESLQAPIQTRCCVRIGSGGFDPVHSGSMHRYWFGANSMWVGESTGSVRAIADRPALLHAGYPALHVLPPPNLGMIEIAVLLL